MCLNFYKISYDKNNEQNELVKNLKQHVYTLSETIGDRSIFKYAKLQDAAEYITEQLRAYGYEVTFQEYLLHGKTVKNIIATKLSSNKNSDEIVVGAHYDTHANPGADDNASGVAVLLELARLLINVQTPSTIKLIAFVNEEPPFFKTENMGSRVFAHQAKIDNTKIRAMISLEMLGYYSDKINSQRYPPLLGFFYPNRANFISVVGNFSSKWLVKKTAETLQKTLSFPVESIATFGFIPGVDFSDQWSFWKENYPAIMITDTAFYRYKHYHKQTDTFGKLNYQNMGEIVSGLEAVVRRI